MRNPITLCFSVICLILIGGGCASKGVDINTAMETCKNFPLTTQKLRLSSDSTTYEHYTDSSVVTKQECMDSMLAGENPYKK